MAEQLNLFGDIQEEKHESEMRSSRLSHAILQTIINHAAANSVTKQEIVMALIDTTGYWQKKIIRDTLTATRKMAQ